MDIQKVSSISVGNNASPDTVRLYLGSSLSQISSTLNKVVSVLMPMSQELAGGVLENTDPRYTLQPVFSSIGINPLTKGIDGTSIYTFSRPELVGGKPFYKTLHPIFWLEDENNPNFSRPKTIYESFNSLMAWVKSEISNIEVSIINQGGDTCITDCEYTKAFIGYNAFDPTGTRNSNSISEKVDKALAQLQQLTEDTMGEGYTFKPLNGGDFTGKKNCSLNDKINALLNLHDGGAYIDPDGNVSCSISLSPDSGGGGSPGSSDLYVYEAYELGTSTIDNSGAYSKIEFDSERESSSYFSISSGIVTVNETALYEISYSASIDKLNALSPAICEVSIFRNGTLVPGSSSYSYHYSMMSGEGTASKSIVLSLNQNDTLEIRAKAISNNKEDLVSKAGGSNIVIKHLKAAETYTEGFFPGMVDNDYWEVLNTDSGAVSHPQQGAAQLTVSGDGVIQSSADNVNKAINLSFNGGLNDLFDLEVLGLIPNNGDNLWLEWDSVDGIWKGTTSPGIALSVAAGGAESSNEKRLIKNGQVSGYLRNIVGLDGILLGADNDHIEISLDQAWLNNNITGTGTVVDGLNLGGGEEIFIQENAGNLEFRTLSSSSLVVSTVGNSISIESDIINSFLDVETDNGTASANQPNSTLNIKGGVNIETSVAGGEILINAIDPIADTKILDGYIYSFENPSSPGTYICIMSFLTLNQKANNASVTSFSLGSTNFVEKCNTVEGGVINKIKPDDGYVLEFVDFGLSSEIVFGEAVTWDNLNMYRKPLELNSKYSFYDEGGTFDIYNIDLVAPYGETITPGNYDLYIFLNEVESVYNGTQAPAMQEVISVSAGDIATDVLGLSIIDGSANDAIGVPIVSAYSNYLNTYARASKLIIFLVKEGHDFKECFPLVIDENYIYNEI